MGSFYIWGERIIFIITKQSSVQFRHITRFVPKAKTEKRSLFTLGSIWLLVYKRDWVQQEILDKPHRWLSSPNMSQKVVKKRLALDPFIFLLFILFLVMLYIRCCAYSAIISSDPIRIRINNSLVDYCKNNYYFSITILLV